MEELDRRKHDADELGAKARAAARLLDDLRHEGRLDAGVQTASGGLVRVELNHRTVDVSAPFFVEASADNRILAVAWNLSREAGNAGAVTLLSRDVILRIKADALGLPAADYLDAPAPTAATTSDPVEWAVARSVIDQLYKEHHVAVPDLDLACNQFAILRDQAGGSQSALARCVEPGIFERCRASETVWGIKPRNVQQRIALELLLDDRVQMVTLAGTAGTGKTLLALAAGLHKVEDEQAYRRLVVCRPLVPMGRDLGYLPGTREEKLRPWMQPIFDNLEHLFGLDGSGSRDVDAILSGMKGLVVEALTHIRGRSIPHQFLIVDEAQNLTRHEAKTVVTRAGEGTKVVLLGDLDQIDHPYLDRQTNGLAHTIERFRGQPLAGHVQLVRGERSPLAKLAADLL